MKKVLTHFIIFSLLAICITSCSMCASHLYLFVIVIPNIFKVVSFFRFKLLSILKLHFFFRQICKFLDFGIERLGPE